MNNQLVDGTAAATSADVEARLESLNITFATVSHPPMFTVKDSKSHRINNPGGYSKNLFLRNKKGRMCLVTLQEDREINLRALGEMVGLGRVSFASAERLMLYLGVIPGAVTPLAVINDKSLRVSAYIDAALLEQNPLHFHPCDNTQTTTLTADDLMRFMQACDHHPQILQF